MRFINVILIGLLIGACHSAEPAKAPPPKPAEKPASVTLNQWDSVKCETFTEDDLMFPSYFNEETLTSFVNNVCVNLTKDQCSAAFVSGFCNLVEARYYLGNGEMAMSVFDECITMKSDTSCLRFMEQVMLDTHNQSCAAQSNANK